MLYNCNFKGQKGCFTQNLYFVQILYMNGIHTENHTIKMAIFIVNVTNLYISPLKVDAIVEKTGVL